MQILTVNFLARLIEEKTFFLLRNVFFSNHYLYANDNPEDAKKEQIYLKPLEKKNPISVSFEFSSQAKPQISVTLKDSGVKEDCYEGIPIGFLWYFDGKQLIPYKNYHNGKKAVCALRIEDEIKMYKPDLPRERSHSSLGSLFFFCIFLIFSKEYQKQTNRHFGYQELGKESFFCDK